MTRSASAGISELVTTRAGKEPSKLVNTVSRHEIGTLDCKDHNLQAVLRIYANQTSVANSCPLTVFRSGRISSVYIVGWWVTLFLNL